jgi:hypothetical protein
MAGVLKLRLAPSERHLIVAFSSDQLLPGLCENTMV